MSEINKLALLAEIKRRARLAEEEANKPKLVVEDYCFDEQIKFINDKAKFKTAVCTRRAGKCKAKGTLVKTPTGSKKIEDLKIGDDVYGYNSDGTVSITKVLSVINQGTKDVVDLIHNRKVIATSTLDHRWLAHNTYNNKRVVKPLKDFNSRDRIAEEYVPIPGGNKLVEHAYALGALLGDGCSRDSGVCISSEDNIVPNICAKLLGAVEVKKNSSNYTYRLKGVKTKDIPYYNEWIKGKYAHQKTFDLEEVRTWTRKSQLEFISGLIDTDGSVHISKDNRLCISLHTQSKTIITGIKNLILDLFQYNPKIRTDNRDKYKNGPVYYIRISNNKFSKRILEELPLRLERKKWKKEYDDLVERNTNEKYTGFTLSKIYKTETYDITVGNDTSLYLDANGLITHNTISCAVDLVDTAKNNDRVNVLYVTLNKQSAKRIIWKDLLELNETFELGGKTNENELTMTFPNKSTIYISGAKDASEIEKFRGMSLKKVYIDEAQSFRSYLQDLIDEVLVPALFDHDGQFIMIGTPGPVCTGIFYEASHSDTWSNHKWNLLKNPHLKRTSGKDPQQIINEEKARRGIDDSDPKFRREYLGEWVHDMDSLVFKFDKTKNLYTNVKPNLTYVIGVDLGYNDADAIAVLGYEKHTKEVYLVKEIVKRKQNISQLIKHVERVIAKYDPVKVVMDAGALGKKIQEEIRFRHSINMEAAQKERKLEFIELLNDDLRTSKFKALPNSIFESDSYQVQWDRDNPERPKISSIFHSDICDAVLYAWRECRHYMSEPLEKELKYGTPEYVRKEEREYARKLKQARTNPEMAEFEDICKDFEQDLSGDIWGEEEL